MTARTLAPHELITRCDPKSLRVEPLDAQPRTIVGQPRAVAAIEFGLAMQRPDYHLFVMGPPGTGRKALVRQAIAGHAAARERRSDWVYVNNFEQPYKPLALALPVGRGTRLREDLQGLVRDLRTMIPAMFDSEEYATEVERINTEVKERADQTFADVGREAQQRGLALVRTPVGLTVAPQKDGEVMPQQAFEALPQAEREALQKAMVEVQEMLVKALRSSMRLRKEHADRVRELNRSMTRVAVDHAIEEVRSRYADLPKVARWLDALSADVIEHAEDFRPREDESPAAAEQADPLARYEVNLVLDASAGEGAPIVEADLPSHQNLVGRIDHIARFGMLMTDYRLIKGGLLHRANGGYLVIDAVKLLTQPLAWATLKRALLRGEIVIESMADLVGVISTIQLDPEPIPLALKVVLIGDRHICALLQAYDEEFDRLFRVVVDLDDDMPRNADNEPALARALATELRERKLLPASAEALARTIDHAARLADDSTRISANLRQLIDVLQEAEYLARTQQRAQIDAADVDAAIAARRARTARVNERLREMTLRDIVMIATAGERVGQINALSVYEVGGARFGMPTRVSATTRLGNGEVIDIQRETAMGGPVHAKGVMILSSFLAARFSRLRPHSIAASLVFEQTYGMVEGDSASLAELSTLLSSIADLPIRQCFAVTGSVNQFGDVQAIGGVNEKIEGFFDVCTARGLDGSHGVIIPHSNVAHLMLRDDVVAAVDARKFHVHAVTTVDDAIELLTGVAAGDPDRPGVTTVNGRIARRLHEYALRRRGEPLTVRRRPAKTTRRPSGSEDGE